MATPPPGVALDAAGGIGGYPIKKEIGAGGMSIVYLSEQQPLGRVVAIKVLRPEVAVQPHLVKRFEREALSLAALHHENILHIYDYRTDGSLPFMVTEYIEGVDLYDILERHERVPYDVAAVIALQVARALDYAHSRGVIHRDVKPANVMLTIQGGLKLMDFGIARTELADDLTEVGTGVGTPAYMSPEQILGEKLDGRTDIWSLGVVLYQMVTGKKPFLQDEQTSVLQKIRLDRPVPPRQIVPNVPRQLERIILRCLEKRKNDRYPVAHHLALALDRFVADRVSSPYSAHLIGYLRTNDEITEQQAEAGLEPGRLSDQNANSLKAGRLNSGRPLGIPLAVWVGGVAVLLILTLTLVVLVSWPSLRSDRENKRCAPSQTGSGAAMSAVAEPRPPLAHTLGGLRVVVHPWAEVLIQGRIVETTPFDRPLPLPEGRHLVLLRHPQLGKATRVVEIQKGRVQTLVVDLTATGKKKADPGSGTMKPASGGGKR